MTAPAPVVRARGLTHRYGATTALDDVSLDIPAGRIAGVIGPDAVGKSTLLALIAGVRRLQRGSMAVLGGDLRDRRHLRACRLRIAYMPQGLGRNLYPTLSVRENLDFFGRLFGQPQAERASRIDELLAATGLDPFPDRPAGKLSGGMKQKLGLCCALIHDPDLLVLDEPTTGVDPLSRRHFWDLIARMRARWPGMSVIVATAYMEEAERFDWLAAMDGGRVIASGTPAAVRARADAATLEAAFVNLLPEARRAGQVPVTVPPRPAGAGTVAIEAQGLTCRFGPFVAVDNVSFRIERGEIFGFLGSNGCGKTTTMKMLTGLLPATSGEARLFGQRLDPADMQIRRRVGYMSQSFSLYAELTVLQNLELHAHLFQLPADRVSGRIDEMLRRFDLAAVAHSRPESLPLGVRQRLQLAVAVIHAPEVLILDEPTSGVDPVARDAFWCILIALSRDEGVTIFLSTHFMNEAQRCDRVSLMHAGRVLAVGAPDALARGRGAATLEEAFVSYLEEASDPSFPGRGESSYVVARPDSRRPERSAEGAQSRDLASTTTASVVEIRSLDYAALRAAPLGTTGNWQHAKALSPGGRTAQVQRGDRPFDAGRIWAYARREAMEILRDPVRLAFALLGPLLLMVAFGYGISFDVERLPWAAFDQDRSRESRALLEGFTGSRYFEERPPIASPAEIEARLRSGELKLVIEIPAGFGRDVLRGERTAVAAWLDGAMPFRAETARGYVEGVARAWAEAQAALSPQRVGTDLSAVVESRFRYNQAFRSVFAIVPGIVMLMLVLIPAMMTAVGVVREKETGAIANFRATPVTRLEFLLGKQLPYVAIATTSFLSLLLMALLLFGVPVQGSIATLCGGSLLYVMATTACGLLVSSFTRTQIAAIFATSIATIIPAVNFSGLLVPVSALSGGGRALGLAFPAAWFQQVSVGTFAKGLGIVDLWPDLLMLAAFGAGFILLATLVLPKQEA